MMVLRMGVDPAPTRPSHLGVAGMDAPGEVDDAVLRGCRASDAAAFRFFVERYQTRVFALLSRMLGPGPHVRDLAQETFFRAFRAFPTSDVGGPAKPSTWLLTIATRLALDSRKSAATRNVSLDEAPALVATETPEGAHASAEIGAAIANAAASLPDDQRAAFLLAEFHAASTADIARALGVGEATAKTKLFRARARLRELLAPYWTEVHR